MTPDESKLLPDASPVSGSVGSVRSRPGRWRRILGSPWIHLVAAVVVIALAQGFLVKAYQVPSESMEPTLQPGDRLLASRLAYAAAAPQVGDVIVFDRPESWDASPPPEVSPVRAAVGWLGDLVGIGPSNARALVKRVIGEPGQTVSCCTFEGNVIVDDAPLAEPYLELDLPFVVGVLDCDSMPRSARCFGPITVPDGQYLVMGDNRAASSDSISPCRGQPAVIDCARFVPRDQIVGAVSFLFWPFDRWGLLTERRP